MQYVVSLMISIHEANTCISYARCSIQLLFYCIENIEKGLVYQDHAIRLCFNHEILSETYPLRKTTGSTLSFDGAAQNRVGETAMAHRPSNAP